jgi:hypothetical protein
MVKSAVAVGEVSMFVTVLSKLAVVVGRVPGVQFEAVFRLFEGVVAFQVADPE